MDFQNVDNQEDDLHEVSYPVPEGFEGKKLRIAGIEPESFVDGPGIRFSIFTQGCSHNCLGCHNPQTHDFNGGHDISLAELLSMIEENPLLDGVTLSGGDPMFQAKTLVPLAREIKERGLNLVIFSGFTYERLMALKDEKPECLELLTFADILVDGPFILAQRCLDLKFRGSKNQRLVDVQASLSAGRVVLHQIQLDEMQNRPDLFE
ncbi:MAG: anaerobic ribonucleoside-triphosphate reductase activating protein [Fibrobacter sp.]|nr:anaerobic ribonucleoside-triphosphate reductase activating protein [Fibrobacter sp.]